MLWISFCCVFFVLFGRISAGTIAKRNAGNFTAEVCSYTFNVVAGTGETLPSGISNGSLAQLTSSMTSHYADVDAKLDAILAALAQHDDDTGDDDDNASGGNVGVVYKRWGRKECPENATLLYEGNAILNEN